MNDYEEVDYDNLEDSSFHTNDRSVDYPFDDELDSRVRRIEYNVRLDQFLNNGILIVGVLLILVLVIAFLL